MRRREFIAGLGSAAAWPVVARAQQATMPVIGWLNVPAAPGTMERFLPAFYQGLADTGYVVGRNVTMESHEGGVDRLPALAAHVFPCCAPSRTRRAGRRGSGWRGPSARSDH
jgi:putative ABC transport system substrate-binding protein